jgi:hypothetical protein
MTFSVQDILKPYPEEHQGKYDLVYVRLVCLALKEDQLETAVTNMLSLLSSSPRLHMRGSYDTD